MEYELKGLNGKFIYGKVERPIVEWEIVRIDEAVLIRVRLQDGYVRLCLPIPPEARTPTDPAADPVIEKPNDSIAALPAKLSIMEERLAHLERCEQARQDQADDDRWHDRH